MNRQHSYKMLQLIVKLKIRKALKMTSYVWKILYLFKPGSRQFKIKAMAVTFKTVKPG